MDALVKATLESLVKKVLPQLQSRLTVNLQNQDSRPDDELCYLIEECRDLLDLALRWTRNPEAPHASEEAVAEADASIALAALGSSRGRDAADQDLSMTADANTQDISDQEALALLAQMEEPPSDSDELSDEEAEALLRDMEAPPILKPSSPSSPSKTKLASKLTMEDDEAARLLAEMNEEPVAEASPESEVPDIHDTHTEDLDEEEQQNIPEWEPNDFQSDEVMLNDFITNADELMQSLDEAILRLEQEPNNKGIIEEIFRAAHTLKGGSGMFGFKGIERVMHRLESLFDLIRKDKLAPNSDTIDAVFQGLDVLKTLLQAVKDGKPCGIDINPVVRALGLAAKGRPPAKRAQTKTLIASQDTPIPNEAKDKDAKLADNQDAARKKEQSTIRVDLERLDVLVNLVGELVIDRTRFASIEEELRTEYPQLKLRSNFSEIVQLFGRHMNEIQDIIMKVRMVPIGNAFNKFTRVVRDIARSLDKKIELVISGEQAELDKTLVEQIGDPLIHLIRNSCDHGIELPDMRRQKGKDPCGKVYLSATQEGNQIVIKIEDDGKGIDPAIIRRKAIEKGLIAEDEQLNDRDILNLIFEPGFSTAEQVTNLSGRGVGMDVVKKQIQKLKGMIELQSRPGHGTSTTIRLPLTLAIVQSLLVRSQGETFAIPLATVIESIRISPKDIQRIGDAEVYRLRDTVLPLVHLDEIMQLSSIEGSISDLLNHREQGRKLRSKGDRVFVVVVGHPDRPTGIIVDQLLNQQEMVIKSMGPLMRNIPCVAGGAVLGHGEVVLVLDIPELEAVSRGRSRSQAA